MNIFTTRAHPRALAAALSALFAAGLLGGCNKPEPAPMESSGPAPATTDPGPTPPANDPAPATAMPPGDLPSANLPPPTDTPSDTPPVQNPQPTPTDPTGPPPPSEDRAPSMR